MLERFRQISRAGLHLREQARVFDRDQRLVAKGLGLGDFLGAEGVRVLLANDQHAHALSLAQKRKVDRRIDADEILDLTFVRGQLDLGPIRQVQHGFAENRARRKIARSCR